MPLLEVFLNLDPCKLPTGLHPSCRKATGLPVGYGCTGWLGAFTAPPLLPLPPLQIWVCAIWQRGGGTGSHQHPGWHVSAWPHAASQVCRCRRRCEGSRAAAQAWFYAAANCFSSSRLAGGEVQSILRCLLLASHTQQPAGHLNPPLACACLILTVRSTATQGGANSGWATSALSALHWSLWWAGSELATSLQQYGACTAPNRRLLPRRVLQARQPCRPHRG